VIAKLLAWLNEEADSADNLAAQTSTPEGRAFYDGQTTAYDRVVDYLRSESWKEG
jgi:hypothetical protein